jgi:hypothetical protein
MHMNHYDLYQDDVSELRIFFAWKIFVQFHTHTQFDNSKYDIKVSYVLKYNMFYIVYSLPGLPLYISLPSLPSDLLFLKIKMKRNVLDDVIRYVIVACSKTNFRMLQQNKILNTINNFYFSPHYTYRYVKQIER